MMKKQGSLLKLMNRIILVMTLIMNTTDNHILNLNLELNFIGSTLINKILIYILRLVLYTKKLWTNKNELYM